MWTFNTINYVSDKTGRTRQKYSDLYGGVVWSITPNDKNVVLRRIGLVWSDECLENQRPYIVPYHNT